jgi:hypothetical protein
MVPSVDAAAYKFEVVWDDGLYKPSWDGLAQTADLGVVSADRFVEPLRGVGGTLHRAPSHQEHCTIKEPKRRASDGASMRADLSLNVLGPKVYAFKRSIDMS